jgi:hypothetical protein
MPIPTKFDGELGEVENLAAGIQLQLKVMQHCAAASDLPRMRAALRDALKTYVATVMTTARDQ